MAKQLPPEVDTLQLIFDNVPVMISLWDARGRLLLANRQWQRVVGWNSQDERSGVDILAEALPAQAEYLRALDTLARPTGEWREVTVRARDGSQVEGAWSTVAFPDGTRITTGVDISARKRAEERTEQLASQLRALGAHLTRVREDEATRISRELHDALGALLTALRWEIEGLKVQVSTAAPPARANELDSHFGEVLTTLGTITDDVRRIASDLRPAILDQLGLCIAIEWQAQQFNRRTGVDVHVDCPVASEDILPDQAITIFRIVQEALTNVGRHARASRVDVSLKREDGTYLLTIQDDGVGLPKIPDGQHGGMGLVGMRERARLIGGTMEFADAAPGTILTLRVPVGGP